MEVGYYAANYLAFFLILLGSLIIGYIVYWIFKHVLWNLAKTTPTLFDDILIDDIEEPFVILIVLFGLYLGARYLGMNPMVQVWYFRTLLIIAIFNIAYFLLKFADDLIEEYLVPMVQQTKTLLDDFYLAVFRKTYAFFIVTMAILFILLGIGINVGAIIMWTAIVFGVFLILEFIFLGKTLVYYGMFKSGFVEQGDILELPRDKLLGIVDYFTMSHTVLKDAKGNKLIIPNEIIKKSPIRVIKPKVEKVKKKSNKKRRR